MAERNTSETIPRSLLTGAGVMVLLALVFSGVSSTTDIGALRVSTSPPASVVRIQFRDEADGSVTVFDADHDEIVAVVAPNSNGFLRGVMRGFVRSRMLHNEGPETPFQFIRRQDGRHSVVDPATGKRVELDAFGWNNVGAFSRLMDEALKAREANKHRLVSAGGGAPNILPAIQTQLQ